MIRFLTIGLLPPLVHELWMRDLPLGWLLWVVTFPVLVRSFQERKRDLPFFLLFSSLALLPFHPSNTLRFLVQIVFPAYISGKFLSRGDLRLRDTLWLSSLALLGSIVVGWVFGMGDRLREVIVPAGVPTGWMKPLLDQWEGFLRSVLPDSLLYMRALSFVADFEPVLWSSLLPVFMGMGIGMALFLWDPKALTHLRNRDLAFDLALGCFSICLGIATLSRGFISILCGEIAVATGIFFLLEGIGLLLQFLKNLSVSRWISFCGLVVIFREPLVWFFLPFVGLASGFFVHKEGGGNS